MAISYKWGVVAWQRNQYEAVSVEECQRTYGDESLKGESLEKKRKEG